MDTNHNKDKSEYVVEEPPRSGPTSGWLIFFLVVLLAATGISLGVIYHQSASMSQLESKDQALNDTVGQMRSQMDMLNAKIVDLSKPPAPPADAVQPNAKQARAKRATEDKRWKKVQGQLDDQQKQLKQTQEDLAAARTDFDGRLGSTRDELNGSIARTHDELVELEKRGERSFFEFDLTKSKQFQRTGPIQLSLRRTDPKHKNYDLQMLVDDDQLTKKKVNLYEPVWIHSTNNSQPVQVVVNRIDKNRVHGYVSAPKYSTSDISRKTTTTPEATNVAEKSTPPQNDPQPQPPR